MSSQSSAQHPSDSPQSPAHTPSVASKVIASAKYPQQAELAAKMGADIVTGAETRRTHRPRSRRDRRRRRRRCSRIRRRTPSRILPRSHQSHPQPGHHGPTSAASRYPWKSTSSTPLIREIKIISSNCYGIIDGVHDYQIAINLLATGQYPYREAVKTPLRPRTNRPPPSTPPSTKPPAP